MIEVYGFERAAGTAFLWTTVDHRAAHDFAARNKARVIANRYEFVDSEPIVEWDYTEREDPT